MHLTIALLLLLVQKAPVRLEKTFSVEDRTGCDIALVKLCLKIKGNDIMQSARWDSSPQFVQKMLERILLLSW